MPFSALLCSVATSIAGLRIQSSVTGTTHRLIQCGESELRAPATTTEEQERDENNRDDEDASLRYRPPSSSSTCALRLLVDVPSVFRGHLQRVVMKISPISAYVDTPTLLELFSYAEAIASNLMPPARPRREDGVCNKEGGVVNKVDSSPSPLFINELEISAIRFSLTWKDARLPQLLLPKWISIPSHLISLTDLQISLTPFASDRPPLSVADVALVIQRHVRGQALKQVCGSVFLHYYYGDQIRHRSFVILSRCPYGARCSCLSPPLCFVLLLA